MTGSSRLSRKPIILQRREAHGAFQIHHVAWRVRDIAEAIDWWLPFIGGEVLYQDNTFGSIACHDIGLNFVPLSGCHPTHIAVRCTKPQAEQYGTLILHRDGTRSCYVLDPSGNALELLVLPS